MTFLPCKIYDENSSLSSSYSTTIKGIQALSIQTSGTCLYATPGEPSALNPEPLAGFRVKGKV